MAVREQLPQATLHMWTRRRIDAEKLRQRGIAQRVTVDLSAAVGGCDLVVLATPIGVMAELVGALVRAKALHPGAVLTDVGSVKHCVVEAVEAELRGSTSVFVGSHPMAGSEQTGIDHARADLFQGASCVLTPGMTCTPDDVARVAAFWQKLGGRTMEMTPAEHDAAVARISHLPHLMASLIVSTALADAPEAAKLAGPGFRDTTRVAAGSPEMWAEILLENREALQPRLEEMGQRVRETLAFLEDMQHEDLLRSLQEARDLRARGTEPS